MDVNDKNIRSKLKLLRSKFPKEIVEATRLAAIEGKNYAASIAPYDTGETSKGIVSAIQYQTGGKIGAIIGYTKIPHPEKFWYNKGEPFNLPYWLNFSPLAPKHSSYKGKNPRFMRATQDLMKKKFPEKISFRVSKVLKETFK